MRQDIMQFGNEVITLIGFDSVEEETLALNSSDLSYLGGGEGTVPFLIRDGRELTPYDNEKDMLEDCVLTRCKECGFMTYDTLGRATSLRMLRGVSRMLVDSNTSVSIHRG